VALRAVPERLGRLRRVRAAALLVLIPAALLAPPLAAADEIAKRGEVLARFMRAVLAEQRGDYRGAVTEIRRATETLPGSPEVLVEGAKLLHRMGRVADAEEFAERALVHDPASREALSLLADIAATRAIREGKGAAEARVRALALYDRLLALGDVDAETLRRIVQLRMDAGDRPGAIDAARRLVADRPGDSQAVGLFAQLLLEAGESRQALETLLAFLATHPGDSPLIRVAQELTRELEAWELVERAFAADAGSSAHALDLQRLRGEALLRLDLVAPASEVLADLAARDPEDRAVRYHLARAYRRMGRLGEASALVEQLVAGDPSDGRMGLLLAEILDDQGATVAALDAYETVLGKLATPDDTAVRDAVRRRVSVLNLTLGRLDAAALALDGLEASDTPDSAHARGRVALARSDWDGARDAARVLRELGDAGTAAMLDAETALRIGRSARAEPKIGEAIAALGPAARVRLAAVQLEVGRTEAGEALLRAWADADPSSAEARFQLGSYLQRAGQTAAAEAELREALRIDPKHAGALNFLGYSWAEAGARLDEAMDLVRRALEVDPWNGAYLDSLGWVLFQSGRYAEAREPLEQAARTFPSDPTVLEHLGDLYARLGDREAAIAAWDRALAAGGGRADELGAKIRGAGEPRQASNEPAGDAHGPTRLPPSVPAPRP